MRFFKEVWGIIWEFNSIGEYICFSLGRLIGVVIFVVGIVLLVKCCGDDVETESTSDYKPIPASVYEYD